MISTMLTIFAANTQECQAGSFLGLRPWYYYINDSQHFDKCDLKHFKLLDSNSDVPLVLLAIVDDLLRIAGIVAVAFIIVGAVRFITSQGNPEDTAQARGTIINALIGLVIVLVAVVFVGFLGNQLGK